MNKAVVEAIQKELNPNVFILRAVQNSLIKEFLECFECVICKDTITLPVVVSSCCESVLGCQGCVNSWTTAGNSSCPKCCSEDDFIARSLKGFQILTRVNSSFTRTGRDLITALAKERLNNYCSCVYDDIFILYFVY